MSVGKIKSNLTSFGSNIKDTLTHHKEFDNEDELISHYQHDMEKSIKALKFISTQTSKLSTKHWPLLLKSNSKIAEQFIKIIGYNSLQFKGIEEYYHEFDKFQAEQGNPMVHPKERQFLIESVNQELCNYLSSIEQLKWKVTKDWGIHAESVRLRINEMNSYLHDILKLIKKRNKKLSNYKKVSRKVDKLQKNTAPLNEKEQSQLISLEIELKESSELYNKLDGKVKSILPHALSFLDEFVENITKLILCKQLDTYKEINYTLYYYSTFHGFLDIANKDHINNYESIMSQWEAAITPTRLQIESFISIIHDKNPELIDVEIDDKDKTSRTAKMWNKVTSKVHEKKHSLVAKDHVNGVFNDYLSVDPLKAFEKFQSPNNNRSETYHPSKRIDIDDIVVPHNALNIKPAPLLPPRSNTANTAKALPIIPASQVSAPLPSTPVPNYLSFNLTSSNESMESIHSESGSSILSESSSHTESSISSDMVLENSSQDLVNKHITKIYNSSKNDITAAPITTSLHMLNTEPKKSDIFNETSTITYKLDQLNKFFDKILKFSDSMQTGHKVLEAKYDFSGIEPGDLSFKKGDKIEILFDFQSIDTLYSRDYNNWLVGMSRLDYSSVRIGFVPNNYF